jgi:hypothetical protein
MPKCFVIDAREKRMFEAIDGRRSISEILDKVKEKGTSPLLFKKLGGMTRWYLTRRRLSDKAIFPSLPKLDPTRKLLTSGSYITIRSHLKSLRG